MAGSPTTCEDLTSNFTQVLSLIRQRTPNDHLGIFICRGNFGDSNYSHPKTRVSKYKVNIRLIGGQSGISVKYGICAVYGSLLFTLDKP